MGSILSANFKIIAPFASRKNAMLKGLASDLTGSADICRPVRDLQKCLAAQYLVPGETIMFSLQSSKEEFTFTNEALLRIEGENATTTRKMVDRFDYKSKQITSVRFETAGRADRDCELKFSIGGTGMSIDIATNEEPTAIEYYKVLELLGREQSANNWKWQFTTSAIGHAAEALRLTDGGEGTLTKQAAAVASWQYEQFTQLQPRCYRDVITLAMEKVRASSTFK